MVDAMTSDEQATAAGLAQAFRDGTAGESPDGEQLDLSDRLSLRRVAGLSTELTDISEVEYRQLKLERVVLVGVWTSGTAKDAENSMAELAALAERHDGYPGRVDCNAARFLAPVSMAAELRSALAEGGYPAPADVGDLAACVCHSLADCYRAAVDELEALTGRRIACLRVVGGGCRNDYLNRLTARALARPLTAGPAEATAIGNLLSQLLHAGEIHTLAEGRALVRASFTLKAYA